MDQLRIFISSPGDVTEERRRAAIVIQRIRREFSRFFDVSAILWEYDPMLSSGHFQDVIEKPSNTDIVVLILWSRLGTPLPPRYQGIDGRSPVTGTEWEFEDALAAKRDRGTPDLLVYRKMLPPQAAFADPDQLAHAQTQWAMLHDFWLRHFIEQDGSFKAAFNQFNALDEFEHELEIHLRALLRERVTKRLHDEGKRPISWHSGSPYRGLAVFDPEHAAIFFGREKAEQELVEAFARRAEAGTAFITVFGASGSGKSSLLRAGVIPTVESPGVVAGVVRWRRLIVTPATLGSDVFTGLAVAMLDGEVLPEAGLAGNAQWWGALMREKPAQAAAGIRATLSAAAQAAELAGGELPLKLFLLVDQLEEIFTAASFDSATRAAFAALLEALARSGAVWVASTMRSDFFARVPEVETLASLTAGDGGYALAAPRPSEIERMIQKPAEAAGCTFEVDPVTGIGLDAELLEAAIAAPGALPLLEFTLDELYRQDIEQRGGSFLGFATFKALGGLDGAIAARAEETVAAQTPEIAAALPGVIRALVQVGEDNRVGARSAPVAELKATPQGAALTDALVAARLLIVSDASVRVAHEALLRAWPRAAALIAEDLDLLRARARAESAMKRWLAEKEAPDFLLPRGRSLAEAAELLQARKGELGADLVRYIEASAAADEARRQAELAAERARAEAEAEAERQKAARAVEQAQAAHRLTQRTRIAAGVLGVMLVGAVGAGVYATIQRGQAIQQRNAALASQSHFLADAATAASDAGDARLARDLALAALPHDLAHPDRPYVAAAESALAQSWGEDRLLAIRAKPDMQPVARPPAGAKPGQFAKLGALLGSVIGNQNLTFTFSHPPGRLTAISGEGHAKVYDNATRLLLDVPHLADKGAVALDAQQAQFAQGEGAGVRLWNIAAKSSRLLGGMGSGETVLKIAFSPDGRRLIAGGVKGAVSVWSLPDGRLIGSIAGVTGPVYDLRVAPQGARAVVVGADGVAALYDTQSGKLIATLGEAQQQAGDVSARGLRQGVGFLASFSEDGTLLATATDASHARIWSALDGTPVGGTMSHDGPLQSFAFNKDTLEVSLLDGRTAVWAAHPPGAAQPIWTRAESAQPMPDGNVLVTDADGLQVVDASGHRLRTLLAAANLNDGAISPDGKWAAVTVGGDSVALVPAAGGAAKTVWHAAPGQKIGLADFTDADNRLIVINRGSPSAMIDVGSGKVVTLLGDGQQNLAFTRHSGAVIAFWKSGKALIYGADGRQTKLATPAGLSLIGITGDGNAKLVATVGIGPVTGFWDMDSGKLVGKAVDGQSLAATRVAFRAGPGGWIARGDTNQDILVWPWPDSGNPMIAAPAAKHLTGHTGLISRLRVTADGRLLSEGQDHSAILWDPLSGRRLARYDGVAASRLSEDGTRLALIDQAGTVRIAHLPPTGQALIDQARAHYGELSPAEKTRYFLDEPAR